MEYAVIYQSKSGNTRMIAEEIYDALETENKILIDLDKTAQVPEADVYFVGFGIHNGFCSMEVLDCFEEIPGGSFAIFATCGYLPTDQYKFNLVKYLDAWFPEDSEYLGMYLCQGNVETERRAIMLGQMPDKERELKGMFEIGSSHPNQEDLESAADFARNVQETAENGGGGSYQ